MKQIDKETERRLRWLFLPSFITVVTVMLDLFLRWNLFSVSTINYALMIMLAIPILGYCIAAIRQKCWGYLAIILAITLIAYFNMTDFSEYIVSPKE